MLIMAMKGVARRSAYWMTTGCRRLRGPALQKEKIVFRMRGLIRGGVTGAIGLAISGAALADGPATGPAGRKKGLTDDQKTQLKSLRSDLDAGKITSQQFATQVDGILGDRAGHGRFGPAARRARVM